MSYLSPCGSKLGPWVSRLVLQAHLSFLSYFNILVIAGRAQDASPARGPGNSFRDTSLFPFGILFPVVSNGTLLI